MLAPKLAGFMIAMKSGWNCMSRGRGVQLLNQDTIGLTERKRSFWDSVMGQFLRVCGMRKGIFIHVTSADRQRLEAIVRDPKPAQKHVWRAWVVLLTANGHGTAAIMAETGKSQTTVWRWQERFMEQGLDGLLRDKTRLSCQASGAATASSQRVQMRMMGLRPPHEATHWTGRAMAKAAGIAVSSVQKIWSEHGLAPHRWRQFKLSNDPAFAEKLHDVVGLYVSPPAHAVVLSIDEKSQIQALDRTQPGLPLKRGRGGTLTHDYKRNGSTTLFAALNVLDGSVFGRNMQRHRHQEFIRFLNGLENDIPADKTVHVILDNYATLKHENVRKWLARHPRWAFHFTPISCSWLNAVEGFFAKKPFIWKADPNEIIAAVKSGFQTLEPVY